MNRLGYISSDVHELTVSLTWEAVYYSCTHAVLTVQCSEHTDIGVGVMTIDIITHPISFILTKFCEYIYL